MRSCSTAESSSRNAGSRLQLGQSPLGLRHSLKQLTKQHSQHPPSAVLNFACSLHLMCRTCNENLLTNTRNAVLPHSCISEVQFSEGRDAQGLQHEQVLLRCKAPQQQGPLGVCPPPTGGVAPPLRQVQHPRMQQRTLQGACSPADKFRIDLSGDPGRDRGKRWLGHLGNRT